MISNTEFKVGISALTELIPIGLYKSYQKCCRYFVNRDTFGHSATHFEFMYKFFPTILESRTRIIMIRPSFSST